MSPQAEQQLVNALQDIAAQLTQLNHKLNAIPTITQNLQTIANKTGRSF